MTPYFAYGSNMLRARLEARLGPCELLGTAVLPGHRLAFHKRGADGSGKCDAHHTGEADHGVMGALYRLSNEQLAQLDEHEGHGYRRHRLAISASSAADNAWLYVARSDWVAPDLPPFDWYHALVVAGAREHRLPLAYLDHLLGTTPRPDPDAKRAARHWPLVPVSTARPAGR